MTRWNDGVRILVFFLLTHTWLWFLYGIGRFAGVSFSYDPGQPGGLFTLLGVPAALIAALLVSSLSRGREGLRSLLSRAFRWQFSPVWYVLAVLIPVGVTAASVALGVLRAGVWVHPGWFSPQFSAGFLVFFLIYNGLGEEIGWRGFALPILQERLGSLLGNVVMGVAWSLWHLPLFLMPGSSQYGVSLPIYVYLLTCWSIVIGLLVHRARGSVLVAILFHETANFIAFTVHIPRPHTLLVWGAAALLAAPFLPRPLLKLPQAERGERAGSPGDHDSC